jgi:hypothetical protein
VLVDTQTKRQPNNQLNNQPTNQATNQPTKQTNKQRKKERNSQTTKQPTNQTTKQPNKSANNQTKQKKCQITPVTNVFKSHVKLLSLRRVKSKSLPGIDMVSRHELGVSSKNNKNEGELQQS